MIHQRLLDGGVDAHMHPAQYGFRPHRGTADALMLARRMIAAATENKSTGLTLLLLDWAKAFDRVKPRSMTVALRRLGLPSHLVEMVGSIYAGRRFFIQDHAGTSSVLTQAAGIAQGCPLSPYLFIIVQSVLLHDVHRRVHLVDEPAYIVTREVLYADDTLLVSSSSGNLQQLLDAIVQEGLKYGLELNWEKTLQMQVSSGARAVRPNGASIQSVKEAVYLGGLLSSEGRATREVCRRIGEGSQSFRTLSRVWSHSGISQWRKIEIYMTTVISKVLYSLDSLWLVQSDRQWQDAFHCRCLRKMLRIPCSYLSRISNEEVLGVACQQRLSTLLQERQVQQYKRIAHLTNDSLVRQVVCNSSGEPMEWHCRRGRGRPRQMWSQSVYKMCK